MMSHWERLAQLPLSVESYSLETLKQQVSSFFERTSTVIHLNGAGEEGLGEDVTYDQVDHELLCAHMQPGSDRAPDLSGDHTLGGFCEMIEDLELFPEPPQREVSRRYRIWAFESAALDLALRQAGVALHEILQLPLEPVRFVVSMRLPEPPTSEPLLRLLERYPDLKFKLDPTSSWDERLLGEIAATGAVESVDFKSFYFGTSVDQPADAELYQRVVAALPDAWIEDPALNEQTDAILAAHRERFSWDAPIHSIADIEALPYAPRMVNIKPSRLGPLSNLLATFEYCRERSIGNYGGGQFELGVGRGQIQYIASLFHGDAPNDVAPSGYNLPDPPAGLPQSPLAPSVSATGFRWA